MKLVPGFAHDKSSLRTLFDESPVNQFIGCARLDRVAIRLLTLWKRSRSAWEHGPRSLLRLSQVIHLHLNHILEGVLSTDAHHFLGCDHALSISGFEGPLIGLDEPKTIGVQIESIYSIALLPESRVKTLLAGRIAADNTS